MKDKYTKPKNTTTTALIFDEFLKWNGKNADRKIIMSTRFDFSKYLECPMTESPKKKLSPLFFSGNYSLFFPLTISSA